MAGHGTLSGSLRGETLYHHYADKPEQALKGGVL
jgi:hypothetical protein